MGPTFNLKCEKCGAKYWKADRTDAAARRGEGEASCDVCGTVMDRWSGVEPWHWLTEHPRKI